MKIWYAITMAIGLLLAPFAVSAQPDQWLPSGMGGGGALFLPSLSPHAEGELYLSCDMGEIFHSSSYGAIWDVPSFRQVGGGNVIGQVQFTSDPNILYVISRNGDGAQPRKSTDGGITWAPLASDPTGQEAFALLADPMSTNRILLTDYTNLYISTDGGASFTRKDRDTSGNGYYIAGAFFNGSTIYLGTNLGLVISTDGGNSFTRKPLTGIPADEAMVSFTALNMNSRLIFCCVTLGTGDVYPGVTGSDHDLYKGVYLLDSMIGLETWTRRTNGIDSNDHPFFVASAPKAENNPTFYVAGGSANGVPIVYTTYDDGLNWYPLFQTTNNKNIMTGWSGDGGDRGWSYGEYALGLAVSPLNPAVALFTDLGFAHLTTDGGGTWREIYTNYLDVNPAGVRTPLGKTYRSNGLENTSAWQLAWSDSSHIFASYSDIRGTLSTDAGISWSQDYTGHIPNTMYYVAVDSANGILYGATSSVHDMYQSTRLSDDLLDGGSGQVHLSRDKGSSWQILHDFHHPVVWLALDPSNPHRLYASVIHSTEGGTLLCTFSGRRAPNGDFTASSGVFISTDGGGSWQDRSSGGMLYWTKDVVVDPHDTTQNTWYVGVFANWGGSPHPPGGLYRTTDRGMHWQQISDIDRVTSCTVDPDNADAAYMTTETEGLWYSKNLRSSTPEFDRVESYPFRQPERVFFNPYEHADVWVTSFGNGLRHSGTRKLEPPPAPILMYPENGTFGSHIYMVGWHAAASALAYHIQVSTTPDFASPLIDRQIPPDTVFYFPNSDTLRLHIQYYWRVAALNEAGQGAWSEIWGFMIEIPDLGVREGNSAANGAAVTCLPNPLNEEAIFTIKATHAGHIRLRIVNMLGELVATPFDGMITTDRTVIAWNTTSIPTGSYFYDLAVDGITQAGSRIEIVH